MAFDAPEEEKDHLTQPQFNINTPNMTTYTNYNAKTFDLKNSS